MKRIIIGGTSHQAGKTALGEVLVRTLRPERWAAAKVTVIESDEEVASHFTDASRIPEFEAHGYVVISEEAIIRQPSSDTGRLVAAGAWPVLWVMARPDRLRTAWDEAEGLLGDVPGIIIESSRLALSLPADLTLCVIGLHVPPSRWKADAPALISRAEIVIVAGAPEGDLKVSRIIADIRRQRRGRPLIICGSVEEAVTTAEMRQRLVALRTPRP
ncbi:MAG TPA: hypothetical protein VNM72_11000 [Blastocatellia bacterium]|nr:hypothetical protein [Blastocatellia bacterium]